MNIDKNIKKELNSFELSELERLLRAIEDQEYYQSGLSKICGGFSNTKAIDIDLEDDGDGEFIIIESTLGEVGQDYSNSNTANYKVYRSVLNDHKMSLKDKLKTIEN